MHHFTQADQVNQLVEASEADPDLGFMARTMALCSLPRTNPGNQLQYKRVNGPYKLSMIAGTDNKLPFGTMGGRNLRCFQGFGHTITVCPKTIVYSHRDGNAVSGMDASSR